MSMNKLLEFRTAYLRAIAQAWLDPSFHELLTTTPIRALEVLGFTWPWPICTLRIMNNPEFTWIGDEWSWSDTLPESLTLHLPLRPQGRTADGNPQDLPVADQAMALADFYRQRASLFSDDWGNNDPSAPERLPSHGSNLDVESGAPIGGFIPTDQSFEAFKVVLITAMAKAWAYPSFRALLLKDAAEALGTVRGYRLPWNMKIRIAEDMNAWWGPIPDVPGRSCWYFENSPQHVLSLYLPTRPDITMSEPIALAMYNATGAEYPFTCTC